MKKNKLIALFAGLSLAFVSSVALAAPSADTLLVAGYDSDQMAVIYGVSGIDQEDGEPSLDCTLVGDFVYELGDKAEEDATEVAVTELWTKDKEAADGKGDPVEFFEENAVEVDGEEAQGVEYVDATEECALTSVTIEPNGDGEINHGTVVSTFANLLQGGNGCLIRHFAQSDFGKGDYEEVTGADATEEEVKVALEVTLDSFETACNKKGKSDSVDGDDDAKGKDKAPGQKKDKADKGNGKANAPGLNKNND